ncbi:hypothetical protein LCGC14_0502380 [marine sediment metagenome]|uniref:Histidine kinase domain-containing protein n=1 Tax=marine sediment metagenome TaxID=412755 RepID=A0A0F9VC82_9ZZZZ
MQTLNEKIKKYYVIILGLFVCFFFLVIEFILFLNHGFYHVIHEIYIRILSISLILAFSLFTQYSSIKRSKLSQKLRMSEMKYRDAYNRSNLYKDIFNHDINNILQNILSSIELSKLYSYDENKKKDFVEATSIITEQIFRAKKLVSNVQKLSEVEDTRKSLSSVEGFFILKTTIERIKGIYGYKNLNIEIEALQNEYFVNANGLLIYIFENILFNSIQHNINPIKEIVIKISKDKRNGTEFIKFEFIDNGIGIPDSRKRNIFLREYKKSKIPSGLGLGLLLIKFILEVYKGEIIVEDRVMGDYSKGSDFIILIPELVSNNTNFYC